MRHQTKPGQLKGWESLKKINQPRTVPVKRRPDGKCKFCDKDIYWFKIQLKNGFRWVAFEYGEDGSKGTKILYNHRAISESEKTCQFSQIK